MKYVYATANVITCNIGLCNLRYHVYIRKFLKRHQSHVTVGHVMLNFANGTVGINMRELFLNFIN